MNEWINGACDQVDRMVAQEPYFRELNQRRLELESHYLQILDSLSPEDREHLTEYAYIVSEMAYQKTQAAYRLGRMFR